MTLERLRQYLTSFNTTMRSSAASSMMGDYVRSDRYDGSCEITMSFVVPFELLNEIRDILYNDQYSGRSIDDYALVAGRNGATSTYAARTSNRINLIDPETIAAAAIVAEARLAMASTGTASVSVSPSITESLPKEEIKKPEKEVSRFTFLEVDEEK